jgi:hypothetical protein
MKWIFISRTKFKSTGFIGQYQAFHYLNVFLRLRSLRIIKSEVVLILLLNYIPIYTFTIARLD